jgi:adenylate kinase family enzyme
LSSNFTSFVSRPPQLITLFGPPGSGKTTVGDWLEACYGFLHLPVGRVLKDSSKVAEIGLDPGDVERTVRSGRTINDPRLLRWLDDAIVSSPRPVVVDGYPRVAAAVEPFNQLINGTLAATEVIALHLECSAATAAARIVQRARDDDRTTNLDDRNDEYARVQRPLLDHLAPRAQVIAIDADAELDIVLARAGAALRLPARIEDMIGVHTPTSLGTN